MAWYLVKPHYESDQPLLCEQKYGKYLLLPKAESLWKQYKIRLYFTTNFIYMGFILK